MRLGLTSLLLFAIVTGCGDDGAQPATCTPGESVACAGPASCPGFQVCNADGTAFDACACSTETTTGSTSSSTGSAAGGGGAGPTTSSSSSGGGGSGGEALFSPADLPGLALWLDSDVGVVEDPQEPGTILRWLDQSGNGLQAEPVNAALFPFTTDPAVLNGHDAIRCPGNGIWLQIEDAAALQWGTGDFAIGMVVRTDTFPTSPTRYFEKMLSFGEGLTFRQTSQSSLEFAIGGINTVGATIPIADDFHIAIMRGQELRLQVDGSMSSAGTAAVNVDNAGAPLMLCMGGSNAPQAAVAEVIAVEGALSDADAAKLYTYWQDKFGL